MQGRAQQCSHASATSRKPFTVFFVTARTPSGAAKLERGRERFRFMWDLCDHGSRRACRYARRPRRLGGCLGDARACRDGARCSPTEPYGSRAWWDANGARWSPTEPYGNLWPRSPMKPNGAQRSPTEPRNPAAEPDGARQSHTEPDGALQSRSPMEPDGARRSPTEPRGAQRNLAARSSAELDGPLRSSMRVSRAAVGHRSVGGHAQSRKHVARYPPL